MGGGGMPRQTKRAQRCRRREVPPRGGDIRFHNLLICNKLRRSHLRKVAPIGYPAVGPGGAADRLRPRLLLLSKICTKKF